MRSHIVFMKHSIILGIMVTMMAGCSASTKASVVPTPSSTAQTATATGITTNTTLDATYTSTDGVYSFQYNRENWTSEPVVDPDFPNGSGLVALQNAFFFALPAPQTIPGSDYSAIMTTFWHSVTDKYTGTGLDIAPFTTMPDVTVNGNTWRVGASYANGGGPGAPVAYYALLHDGKTFFITTFSTTKAIESLYFQPMIASFKFLK